VVTAHTLDPHKRFDESDIQIFELFAGQAAAVLKSVRLFKSERRQRRGAEEDARAAAAIVAEMDQRRRLTSTTEVSHTPIPREVDTFARASYTLSRPRAVRLVSW